MGETWFPPCRLGHYFDLALLGFEATLALEDVLERADRDLELVERRLPGRQPLQPESRREQGHQYPVARVLAGEADQLVGDPGDHGQEQDPARDQPVPGRPAEEGEHEDRDHHYPEQERRPTTWMDEAEALYSLRHELLARLVRIDRLVLRRVVLEDPLEVGQERDEHEVEDEDRDSDQALDDDEPARRLDREPARQEGGRDLEEQEREADRDSEREDESTTTDLRRYLFLVILFLGRVVRRDREGAEPNRERLAERDYAANDRKAEDAVALHHRVDVVVQLRDLAVGLAYGERPVRGAAHHHTLQDGLAPYWCAHNRRIGLARRIRLAAARAARALEPALEALDTSTRIQQLLLARVERMAVRADLDVQLWLGRARFELVAARAANGCGDVIGMDVGLHGRARIAAAVSAETLPPVTTTTVVSPLCTVTCPALSAPTAAAPAGSHASFARS